ncbi:hypothetical protein OUZ56_018230 [Daphnia magna]|uniref:Uncharacterized protein n=1 Tax=Daphnia magna TaxID=35525 RepID=A0ABQ9Z8C7_9CRUS|nr:hypothetical protein OUZ56_018230 [Daphnia magna]
MRSNFKSDSTFLEIFFSERWRVGHEDREKSGREVIFQGEALFVARQRTGEVLECLKKESPNIAIQIKI